jgi:hypothetical protein
MSARIGASVGIMSLFTTFVAPMISLLRVLGRLGPLNTLIPSSRSLVIVGAVNHLMLWGRESLSSCLQPRLKLRLSRMKHRSNRRRSNTGPGVTARLVLTHQLTLVLHHSTAIFQQYLLTVVALHDMQLLLNRFEPIISIHRLHSLRKGWWLSALKISQPIPRRRWHLGLCMQADHGLLHGLKHLCLHSQHLLKSKWWG